MIYGAIEAGGTKMVCAIGNENGEILERISLPTLAPAETMPGIIDFFKDKNIEALGVGCFGPVDLNKESPTWGHILKSPKLDWRGYDFAGALKDGLGVPIGFDTDVNSALLGEATWGSAKGLDDAVYFTVGTGIGAGIMTNGKLLHGMLHPEAGHFRVAVHEDDSYKGCCPTHGACLEGMASGPAIEKRWGKKAELLAENKAVWELEAYYLAQAAVSCIMLLSPQRIIFGGGVMHQEVLLPLIRKNVLQLVNGYIDTPEMQDIDNYIVGPSLNDNQGVMGCIKLAMDAIS